MKKLFSFQNGLHTSNKCLNHKYLKHLLTGTLLIALHGVLWGQTTLYRQNFGTTGSTPTGWTLTNWTLSNANASSGYTGASGGYNAFIGSITGTAYLTYNNTTTPLSTVGYTNITVIWGGRRWTADAVTLYFQWSSNGTNWNTITGWTDVPPDATWYLVNGGGRINLPPEAAGVTNLRLRWYETNPDNGYRLDDVSVQGTLITPGLNVTSVYTTPGTYTWSVPNCVSSLTVEAWGGGGGGFDGSNQGGGKGGGGGGYAKGTITNASGSYNVVVGSGGGEGANGTASTFGGTTVVADYGRGGTSATTGGGAGGTGNTGNVTTSNGGTGGNGNNNGDGGGGGGGAGGPDGAGNAGSNAPYNFGGSGGTGDNGSGGAGGAGGNGSDGGNGTANALGGGGGGGGDDGSVGGNGGFPGAGGGGGENNGGAGANGQVKITYTYPNNPTITLGSNPSVCVGSTSANLTYSATTGCPDKYSIAFDPGITDVVDANLPSSPIVINTTGVVAGTYNGTLTVKNSTYNFTSSGYSIQVIIEATPVSPTLSTSSPASGTTICPGYNSGTATFTGGSGSGSNEYQFSIDGGGTWSAYTNSAAINTTGGTTSVQVRARRSGGACAASAYNTYPIWTFGSTPTAPTLGSASPANGTTICAGFNTGTVTGTGGSGGSTGAANEYQVSINNGSTWASYTSGNSITTTGATGNVIVQARRTGGSYGCSASAWSTICTWSVGTTPTAPTLGSATPANGSTICTGFNTGTVTGTGGSGGSTGAANEYQVSINNGSTWASYTSGNSITTTGATGNVIVQARRTGGSYGCSASAWSTICTWSVGTTPTAPTLGSASPATGSSICAGFNTGTVTGTGGSGGSTGAANEYQVSIDNGNTWSSYTSGSAITTTGGTGSVIVQARRTGGSYGCSASAWSTICTWSITPLPSAAGTITGTSAVCGSTSGVSYSVPAIANATSYLWSYDGSGATINGSTNSITIDFASGATGGNLTVYGVNSYGNGTVSANFPITINAFAWAGDTDDTWELASNWCGGVPTASTNVTIPTGTTVHVTSNPGTPAVCNNLTINGTLVIDAGKALDVGGTLVNNGTTANLVINNNGSLIYDAGNNVPGTAYRTVTHGNNHLFSSAVQSTTFGDVFPLQQDNIWAYLWSPTSNAWVNQTYQSAMTPGLGYLVYANAIAGTQTAEFIGQFNNDGVQQTVSTSNGGWNLLGNPYTSAIDWDNGVWQTGLVNSVAIWTGSNYIYWADGVGDITGGVIPAQNGFFVQANSGTTITIPWSARVHSNQALYKDAIPDVLQLEVKNNEYFDKTYIRFTQQATAGFDDNGDAHKLWGATAVPQIYSILPGEVLAINALPSYEANPLVSMGLKVGTEGDYTLTARNMESFSPQVPIRLDDLKLNTTQDLRLNDTYSFTAAPGDAEHRFNIRFYSPVDVPDPGLAGLLVYADHGRLMVNNSGNYKGLLHVYNAAGQLISTWQMQPGIQTVAHLPIGMYVVKAVTSKATVSRKVILF